MFFNFRFYQGRLFSVRFSFIIAADSPSIAVVDVYRRNDRYPQWYFMTEEYFAKIAGALLALPMFAIRVCNGLLELKLAVRMRGLGDER